MLRSRGRTTFLRLRNILGIMLVSNKLFCNLKQKTDIMHTQVGISAEKMETVGEKKKEPNGNC